MREKDTFTKRIAYEYNQLDTITEFLEEKALEPIEVTLCGIVICDNLVNWNALLPIVVKLLGKVTEVRLLQL